LLTFSNLVHPEKIKFGAVNMGDVIDTSVKKLEELVKKRGVQLTVDKISPNAVLGNVTALEQITINLIKNAIAYNREGGSVNVSVGPDYKGNIVLEVRDTGIGISQDDLIHIFEPFYRAERSRNRQSGSTGLGLTIVSELVKLHYGKISVSSYEKKGTTVTVLLPYNKIESIEPFTSVEEEEQKNVTLNYFKNRRRR
jgi:signal transduction histidine kinase